MFGFEPKAKSIGFGLPAADADQETEEVGICQILLKMIQRLRKRLRCVEIHSFHLLPVGQW